MQDLVKGARYLIQGFSLINQPGVRRFAYLPMAINTLLFSIAIWFGISEFDPWMNALMPTWLPEWLASALMWILWPIFLLLLVLIVFFTFSIIANMLAAPFNGPLAEAVEIKLSGQAPPAMAWTRIIKDTPKMIFNEIRKLGYLLIWMIPLLLLSFIPVVNIVSPLLWVLFSSWILALDYHDFPMGNHQLLFNQQRMVLKQKRGLALGFGLATMGATMIPILNFLVIPAAVAGATALYLENLKPD
ncbi:sulfate transporter CysZ [Methylophaga sp. OBS4]|uniref:sulfate transporter CysZ n=1 Tax=Methylophaga sp. OBS4 TaxID=2991935 RepID=UPI00224E08F4|nr:sulfate transporter CysZ [Methylophaga sp. OBS4]MCX4186320.1 sulfate transporter CysZ [Methylophaga sp. OBS4]